jgi:hypothetical protein
VLKVGSWTNIQRSRHVEAAPQVLYAKIIPNCAFAKYSVPLPLYLPLLCVSAPLRAPFPLRLRVFPFASPRLCVPPFLCVSASPPLRLRASACPLSSASPRLLLCVSAPLRAPFPSPPRLPLCVSAPLRALFPLRLRVFPSASPRLRVSGPNKSAASEIEF